MGSETAGLAFFLFFTSVIITLFAFVLVGLRQPETEERKRKRKRKNRAIHPRGRLSWSRQQREKDGGQTSGSMKTAQVRARA